MSAITSSVFTAPPTYSGNKISGNNIASTISNGENSAVQVDVSTSANITAPETKKKPASHAADDFLAYMQKSPAERMREEILKRLGITEDDITKMSPPEKKAIEKQIADEIKRMLGSSESNSTSEIEPGQNPSNLNQILSDGIKSALLNLQQVEG